MNLTRSGVLDSFALMDLLAEAEATFGVQLDLDVLENESFTSLKGMAKAFTNATGS
jgi:acyl carrier protein